MGKQCDGENLLLIIFMGQQVSSHQEQSLFNILNNHVYILKRKVLIYIKVLAGSVKFRNKLGWG